MELIDEVSECIYNLLDTCGRTYIQIAVIIVWDEPKRLANLNKHGLDFADLTEAFFENAMFVPSRNKRRRGIGVDRSGMICVVFVRLGSEGLSVISMRHASAQERTLYAENLKD